MQADELSPDSRVFYDRAKLKLGASLVAASFFLMLLGFAAESGAQAQSAVYLLEQSSKDSISLNSGDNNRLIDIKGSHGFACFVYLLGSIFLLAVSLYLSPLIGSVNEKRILKIPQEIDGTVSLEQTYRNNQTYGDPQGQGQFSDVTRAGALGAGARSFSQPQSQPRYPTHQPAPQQQQQQQQQQQVYGQHGLGSGGQYGQSAYGQQPASAPAAYRDGDGRGGGVVDGEGEDEEEGEDIDGVQKGDAFRGAAAF